MDSKSTYTIVPRDVAILVLSEVESYYDLIKWSGVCKMFYQEALNIFMKHKRTDEKYIEFATQVSKSLFIDWSTLQNPKSIISHIVIFKVRINVVSLRDDELQWTIERIVYATEPVQAVTKENDIHWDKFPSLHPLTQPFIEKWLGAIGFENIVMHEFGMRQYRFRIQYIEDNQEMFYRLITGSNERVRDAFVSMHSVHHEKLDQLFGTILFRSIYRHMLYRPAKFGDFFEAFVQKYEDSFVAREWDEMRTVRSLFSENYLKRMRAFGKIRW